MKKSSLIILYAALVTLLVGIIVFSVDTQQAPRPTNSTNTTLPQNNSISEPQISIIQLSLHHKKEDCWIGYDGKIYDITDWLPKHPGSSAAIEPYCGTSEEFEKAFEGQHGQSQVQTLIKESVYKGELK